MVLKAAVQALKKADILKAQAVQASANFQSDKGNSTNILLNDSSTWSARQQLTTALHQVLVLDLDYALDQKVEQELWTHGFKNYIATLQSLSRDKKNPKRSELQALLSWCLESATGFYLTLFQELCEAFQLDLPFRRRGIAYGSIVGRTVDQPAVPPQRSSCLYICQYCLVHLGDIARYRNQRKQAESFYKQAVLLSPSSGQPYNQLALLQATRGDRLSTVFYYVRSLTLLHPFPPAATNLSKTLEIVLSKDSLQLDSRSKISTSEYTILFLKLHALLQTGSDLNTAESIVKTLISTLTSLSATQSFSSHRLIQMLAINLYALREATENFNEAQLSADEKQIKFLVLDIIAGSLNALLLPVYTLKADNVLEYHSLPTIKLILEWLKTEPKYLESNVFTARLQIWPSLCLFLNTIQPLVNSFEENKYLRVPLPEDRELQGFLPLDETLNKLNFSCEDYKDDVAILNQLRAIRLIKLGHWLTTHKVIGTNVITVRQADDGVSDVFEPVSKQESNVSDLLKELEQITTNNESPEVSSESKENSQEEDLQSLSQSTIDQPVIKAHQRLRTGILKPQGSLERAREEREQALQLAEDTNSSSHLESNSENISSQLNDLSNLNISSKANKKVRQNVAMQAILKKVEENSKQVKFQTEASTPNKEDLASKKGVLSLKNQSGYPHLTETAEPKKLEPNFQPQFNFSNTLPSNNTNFPINYSQTPFTNPPPRPQTNYRNIPDFIQTSQPFQNSEPYFKPNFDYRPNVPPPKYDFDFNKFQRNYPIENPPEMHQMYPQPHFPPKTNWDNKVSHPPTPTWWNNTNTPPLYSTPTPPFNMEHFNMNPQSFETGDNFTRKEEVTMRPWNSIPPPTPPQYQMVMPNQPSIGNQAEGLTLRQKILKENKKLQSKKVVDSLSESFEHLQPQPQPVPPVGYSLFSSNWGVMPPNTSSSTQVNTSASTNEPNAMFGPQSLFSGPGLTPLERLLEQQKQLLRGNPPK